MKSLERLKRAVRLLEASLTPRSSVVEFRSRDLRFTRSMWWHDEYQALFEREIVPYFTALGSQGVGTAVDAGAATGMFSVACCVSFPGVRVYAFEPSQRQRLLLRRNLNRNGFGNQIRIEALALWNREGQLAFRTHGAIGALREASSLPGDLRFDETVSVTTLDAWAERVALRRLDLLKMDIEGAELEGLQGARTVLQTLKPHVLVQAYHDRGGSRTFERCRSLLTELGYECQEKKSGSGLLSGAHPGAPLTTRDDSAVGL